MYKYLKKTKKIHFNCVKKSKLFSLINKNGNSNFFLQKFKICKNQEFFRNNFKFFFIPNLNFLKKVLTIQLYFLIQNKLKNKKDFIFNFIFLYRSLFDFFIKHKKIVSFLFKIFSFISICLKQRIQKNRNQKKGTKLKKNKIYILKFLTRKQISFFSKNFSSRKKKRNQKISFTSPIFFIKNALKMKKKIQSKKKERNIFSLKAKNFPFFKPIFNFSKFLLNFSQFSFKKIQSFTVQIFFFFKYPLFEKIHFFKMKSFPFFIKNFLNNEIFFRFHNKIFLNNLLLSISNKSFFLKKNVSIFTFKTLNNLRQLKRFSFLKKNQFQFLFYLKQIFYFLEMISFLSKKNFYNKRKKNFFFISKKFLWNHFILKKKAFLTFFSILFSKKFHSLKKKETFLKIFYNSDFFILKKKFQNNLNKRIQKKQIKNELEELFLESFKFAFYFEFYGNFSNSYAFNCFIKELIKTTKKQFLLNDCFSFYKQKISLFLLNCFLKKSLIKRNAYYLFLLKKENFVIFSENFFFILKQLIKIVKKTNDFSKILQIKNDFFLKKSIKKSKFFLNAIFKIFYGEYKNSSNYFDFCKIYSKFEHSFIGSILSKMSSNWKLKKQNSIFKYSLGFLKFILNKYRKPNSIGFYYKSFLLNFNINLFDFFSIFYENCFISKDIPDFFKYLFQIFFLKKKFRIIEKKNTNSIFFTYRKDFNKKTRFFNDFRKFFFNFYFFRIYKIFKIKKKFFLVKKWDPFLAKKKFFLRKKYPNIFKNFWIHHWNCYFYNKNYSKKFFSNKFTTLLIVHKYNVIIFANNNVISNQIFLWYEQFYINSLFDVSFVKNSNKRILERKTPIDLILKKEIFSNKRNFFKKTGFNFKGFLFFISNKEKKRKKNSISFQNPFSSNYTNFFGSLETIDSFKKNQYLLNQKEIFILKKIGIKNYSFEFLNLTNKIGLIPSKRFVKKHLNILKKLLFKYNSQGQLKIIYKFTLKIQDWCYYYRIVTDSKIFCYCDKVIYKLLWKWACYQHANKSKKWIQKKYFFSLKNSKWIFCMIPKDFDSESSSKKIFYLPFHNFSIQT